MRETRFQPGLLLRRLAAVGLVAWLAGLGCLLGCEGPAAIAAAARPTAESHAAAASESCAAMSSGRHCCRAAKARAGATSAGSTSRHDDSAAHCPVGRQTSDPARKVRANDDAPAGAHAPPQSHDSGPPSYHQPSAAGTRVHDRGGTHLRCCVFLI
jgi:hypothetical protein